MFNKKYALVLVLCAVVIAMIISTSALGSFSASSTSAGNTLTAAPDLTPPVVANTIAVRSAGNVTGKIKAGDTYYIYANVNADTGNPASGISSVQTDASNISPGQNNVAMAGGSYTWLSQSYNYRSSLLTSDSGLADGVVNFNVTATDVDGNVSANFSNNITVDNTPQNIYIYSPTLDWTSATSTNSVIFYPIPIGDTGTYRCKIDLLGTYKVCPANSNSAGNTFTGIENGPHTAYVESTDNVGNVAVTTSDFVVDAPTLVIDYPTDNSYINTSTIIPTFTTTESPSSSGDGVTYDYVCRLDVQTQTICPMDYSGLSEGIHTLRVISINSSSERSAYVTHTFTVDTVPPVITMINPTASGFIGSDNVTYDFSANETSTFECKLDAGSYQTCTPNGVGALFTNVSTSAHVAYVRATDQAGNQTVETTNFTVDPFTITFDSPVDNSLTNNPNVSVSWHATESAYSGGNGTFTYACNPNSSGYVPCTSPTDYNGINDGAHNMVLTATNSIGNTVSKTINVTVDATAPTVSRSIIQKASDLNPGYVQSNTLYYAYAQVSDATSGVDTVNADLSNITTGQTAAAMTPGSYTVDGQSYNYRTTTSLTSNVGLADGSKSFTINATDFATNNTPYANTVIADSTAPVFPTASISKTPGYLSNNVKQGGSYYILANLTDINGIATSTTNVNNITTGQTAVTLTGGSYIAQGVSYSYRNTASLSANAVLTAGAKTYTITATDNAGNTATSGNFSVTVDNTAPAGTAGGVQPVNGGGGIAGRINAGDTITLTYNSAMDPESIMPGWNGASTTVSVVGIQQNAANCGGTTNMDTMSVTGTNIGCINAGANTYVTTCAAASTYTFATSTMTLTSGTIVITLGGLQTTTCVFATVGSVVARWGIIAGPYDAAGNAVTVANITESGLDANF